MTIPLGRPGHEVIPRRGTARSTAGPNAGQRADLRNALHFPVEAVCAGCGKRIGCDRWLHGKWAHREGDGS